MQSSNVGTLNPSILADGTDFMALLSQAITAIDSLRPLIAHPKSPTTNDDTTLDTPLLSIRLLFAPQWLKSMTFLCSTLITWLPLMLQSILQQRWTTVHSTKTLQSISSIYPTILTLLSSKPKDQNHQLVSSVDPLIELTQRWQSTDSNKGMIASDALLLVVDKFLHLLDDIKNNLPASSADQADGMALNEAESESLVAYFLQMESTFKDVNTATSAEDDLDRQYLKVTFDHVITSHNVSISRLRQLVDNKIASLVECLSAQIK